MKKIFLTIILLLTPISSFAAGTTSAPWIATSTPSSFVQPNNINGVIQAIKINGTATSTINKLYIPGSLQVDGNIQAGIVITPGSFTQGSVLFVGPSGTLSQNNSNFFWDNTNSRLGVGTVSPQTTLDVGGTVTISGELTKTGYWQLWGDYGNPTNSGLRIKTMGSGTLNDVMTLTPDGNVGVGITTPTKKLHIYDGITAVGAYQQILQGVIGGYGAGLSFQSILTGGSLAEMARITADGEDAWNTTASTQDAGLRLYTSLDGTVAEKVRINASGSVGIGTTNPAQKLDVNGNALIQGGSLIVGSATGVVYFGTPSSNYIYNDGTDFFWRAGGSDRVVVKGSGNVGIGTTAPGGKLEIKGGNNDSLYVNNDGSQYTSSYWLNNGTIRGGIQLDNTDNNLRVFANGATTRLSLGTQATDRMTIDTTGNVGINTVTPYSKLSILGGDTNPSLTVSTGALQNWSDGLTDLALTVDSDSPYAASFQHRHVAASGNYYPISLNPLGGNVGIGTSSPSTKFEIAGSAQTAPLLTLWNTTNNSATGIALKTQVTPPAARNWGIAYNFSEYGDLAFVQSNAQYGDPFSAGTERLHLGAGGNVGVGTVSPNDKLEVAGALNIQGSNSGTTVTPLGTNGGRFKLLNGNVYGLLGDVLTNGNTYLQSGRIDGDSSAYNILLNPLGGNVGIGNTGPNVKLEVSGAGGETIRLSNTNTNPNSIRMLNTGGDVYIGLEGSSAGGYFTGSLAYSTVIYSGTAVQTIIGGSPKMIVNTSGNVGIGTTAPTSPWSKVLQVYDANNAALSVKAGNGGTDWQISTAADGKLNIYDYTAGAHRLNIDTSGNVGIGSTTPAATLTMGKTNGNFFITNNQAGSSVDPSNAIASVVVGNDTTLPTSALYVKNAGNRGTVGNANGSALFRADFSDVTGFIITKDGKVGVATSTPDKTFSVHGQSLLGGNTIVGGNMTATGTAMGTNIMYAEITVTSGEMLALSGSPKTLVAAPGAGKVLEPIDVVLIYDYNSVAYTTASAVVEITEGSTLFNTSMGTSLQTVLAGGSDSITMYPQNTVINPLIENTALLLSNSGADLTDGDSPVRIKITYRVHNTGL